MNMLSKSMMHEYVGKSSRYPVCLAQRYKEYIRSHSTEIVLFMPSCWAISLPSGFSSKLKCVWAVYADCS